MKGLGHYFYQNQVVGQKLLGAIDPVTRVAGVRPVRQVARQFGLALLVWGALQGQASAQSLDRAYGLFNKGWMGEAIAAFQAVLRANPQSVEAQLGLAQAFQKNGQDSEAWSAYQRVVALEGRNAVALTAIGQLGGYRGDWQSGGITALTQLLEIQPGNTEAKAQRALLLGYQGRFAESLADYEPLLAMKSPAPEVLLGAAKILTYSGDGLRALPLFERYKSLGKSLSGWDVAAYGNALRGAGQAEAAIALLKPTLAKTSDGSTTDLRSALALAYGSAGQLTAALQTLAPLQNDAKAQLPLARTLVALGRDQVDADLLRQGMALYERSLQQTASPSIALLQEAAEALALVPEGQAQALRYYEQIEQLKPGPVATLKRLALAQLLGKVEPASFKSQVQKVLAGLPPADAPGASAQWLAIAPALAAIENPDPDWLPYYLQVMAPGFNITAPTTAGVTIGVADTPVPLVLLRLSQMYSTKGNFPFARLAAMQYQQTPEGAKTAAAELLLADLDRREGKLTESADRYRKLSQSPDRKVVRDAQRGLAGILQTQGKWGEALKVYDQIVAANPQDDRAQLSQWQLQYRTGQKSADQTATDLQDWLASRRDASLATPELLGLLGALPPSADWIPLYEKVLAAEPNNLAVERRLIEVLTLKNPAAAQRRLTDRLAQLETAPPTLETALLQGELARLAGQGDRAAQAYEQVLQRQPDNRDVLMALAGLRFEQKRYPEAADHYQKLLAQNPQDMDVQRLLGELAAAQDNPNAALSHFRQSATAASDGPVGNPQPADEMSQRRSRQIQRDFLKRRGFQPGWERY